MSMYLHQSKKRCILTPSSSSKKKRKKKRVDKTIREYVSRKVAKIRSRLHSNIPKVKAKVDKITVDGVFSQTVVIPFLLELGKALHMCGGMHKK